MESDLCPSCRRAKSRSEFEVWRVNRNLRRRLRRARRSPKVRVERRLRGRSWQGVDLRRTVIVCLDPFHQPDPPQPPRGRIVHTPEVADMRTDRHRQMQNKDRR